MAKTIQCPLMGNGGRMCRSVTINSYGNAQWLHCSSRRRAGTCPHNISSEDVVVVMPGPHRTAYRACGMSPREV